VPNDKRARHKAARQAKMAELRRAQQRRRNLRRGGVVGIAVLIAVILALITSGTFDGSKKKTAVKTVNGATTTTTSTVPATTTTVPLSSATPLPLTTLESYLVARAAPAKSAACANPETGTAAGASTAPTTTVPAKGKAVSIVPAPAGVGFPKLDGSAPRYTKFTAAPPFCIDPSDVYTATMKTTAGTIVIELLPKYAPVTVNNFVFLAGYHYFDGTVFHRVIPGFVDQGGDPTATGSGSPGYSFDDELPKSAAAYDAGSVAMANSGANTNGSQFFLVVGTGGKELTDAYTVYGQIVGGLDVADTINAGGDSADNGSPPKTYYTITSVRIHVGPPGSTPPGASAPSSATTVPATTTPVATTVPATTVPATTVPATTVPATTVPATTVPATS
jgi:cyclophilin family peptidyl-prolyl cis-trans isomerase